MANVFTMEFIRRKETPTLHVMSNGYKVQHAMYTCQITLAKIRIYVITLGTKMEKKSKQIQCNNEVWP